MAKLRNETDYPIYFGAKPEIFRLAGNLRKSMTSAEHILWEEIRNRKLSGFKFRRQHPFNNLILDFYCHEARLSIELDGSVHLESHQKERDKERKELLRKSGIHELRFSNWEVENQIKKVLETIVHFLERPGSNSLPPGGGRGRG